MTRVGKYIITPAQVILFGFLALILAGTLLLMLPIATNSGRAASFLDALFTATSATCVTGLVLYDTVLHWSLFGQAVLLLLIQIGGMGVITMAVAVAVFTGRRIGLMQRTVMQESISAPHMGGIVRLTKFAFLSTFAMEGVGAVLLSLRFIPQFGFWKGLWYAVFHAVSAFCNAGFDLMGEKGPFSSLTGYAADPLVGLVIPGLIVVGGLGFFVWGDLRRSRLQVRRYALQTKLVLFTTGLLILLPALILFWGEFSRPHWSELSLGERVLASLFQSVTPRTAGFNTVDLTALAEPSRLLLIFLMLVGGSPGSTAGGIKTTTLAVLALCVSSVFRKRQSIQCFRRRVDGAVLRSAVAILFLYLFLFLAGGAILCYADGVPLSAALFETASAIGTVGLSLGITPGLGVLSRFVLIALMYFGRVGCLTMLCMVLDRQQNAPAQLPLEHITVG